ncbi:hypothetical protein D3C78_1215200 [compost metagenome]
MPAARTAHDDADGTRPAGCQPDGVGIRPVAVFQRSIHHPLPRFLAHLGIAAKRPADGGGRQPDLFCEFLEFHVFRQFAPACVAAADFSSGQ